MKNSPRIVLAYSLVFTFILLFYTASFAQIENIKGVQFKDGSIIYGKVIRLNVNDVQIETKDGKIISRKFDDVETFIKDGDSVVKKGDNNSIAGKVGITARGGASYVFNSEWTNYAVDWFDGKVKSVVHLDRDIKPSSGWTAGGGLMYGITDNLAVTFDVVYFQTDLKASIVGYETAFGQGKTVDFALGAQWRFMPTNRIVPYVGAGVDIMSNKLSLNNECETLTDRLGMSSDVATTYGGHLALGADFFITPNIALNAEIRGLYSTKGDVILKEVGYADQVIAEYNPSNISGFLGIRFFFP
jgi:opacity protein-like surface antigen